MATDKVSEPLQPAQLDLQRQTPASLAFDDIYFSPDDGIGESRYHFIEGNQLPQRFADRLAAGRAGAVSNFTVAETGFGTGLNFLLTAELWQHSVDTAVDEAIDKTASYAMTERPTLYYLSAEKHPIPKAQLSDIYRAQGWHNELSQALLATYPNTLTAGAHVLTLQAGSADVQLTLLFGDATTQFQARDFVADAWFLDGFAPSKNPDLWTPALFACMAERSRTGTTFATFTAASAVRRGLQAAGFSVFKGKGFGRKRERLLGRVLNC
ncbi:MAG: hypothetical protein CR974_01430 [Gammaproteobacteria bacterium]|nr:MAG: hypothetical protein CR974_01430 [Gammaproteobacteria bacterium]